MTVTSKSGKYFWSNGYQYGMVEISGEGKNKQAKLSLLNGSLMLDSFTLKEFGKVTFKKEKTFDQGETITFKIENNFK